jgi:hypothetical protein
MFCNWVKTETLISNKICLQDSVNKASCIFLLGGGGGVDIELNECENLFSMLFFIWHLTLKYIILLRMCRIRKCYYCFELYIFCYSQTSYYFK